MAVFVVLSIHVGSGVVAASERVSDATSTVDQIVLQVYPGPRSVEFDHIGAQYGIDVAAVRALGGGFHALTLTRPISSMEATAIVGALVAQGVAISAEIDAVHFPSVVPIDPLFTEQRHFQTSMLDLPGAWEVTRGAAEIIVAVIDTGRLEHPEMEGRFVEGYDFIALQSNSKDGDGWDPDERDVGDWSETSIPYTCSFNPRPSTWHGTHVAGIIATNDDTVGITGIAPDVRIQHIRVLGTCGGRTSDEAAAIRWAAGLSVPGVPNNPTPAKVINLSLGSATACHAVEQAAINDAVAAGATVVVAAGNSGRNLDVVEFSPANCDNVITVAALQENLDLALYSNYGARVEIAAPGGPISSLTNTGTREATEVWAYGYKQGTSMATPMVAGVAALVLSVNPTLKAAEVAQILTSSARPLPCSDAAATFRCGAGMVDAAAAVRLAAQSLPGNRILRTRIGGDGGQFSTNLAGEQLADRTDVILVSGSVYPDGLAAAALAKQEDADIILVPADGLGALQIAAIVAEEPRTVWIVGGPQAVPESVEAQLTDPIASGGAGIAATRIERVYGATRYETAVAVSQRIETIAYLAAQRTAFIVRGDSFADAVIAGPAAFGIYEGIGSHPVYLVERDVVPVSVIQALLERGIERVLIVGGPLVVSDVVRASIAYFGITTTRVAGADRYETAAKLGQLLITPIDLGGFGWNPGDVALVNISDASGGFDAVSAAGFLGPWRRMLLGVTHDRLPAHTAHYLRTLSGLTTRLTVVGDVREVADTVIADAALALGP